MHQHCNKEEVVGEVVVVGGVEAVVAVEVAHTQEAKAVAQNVELIQHVSKSAIDLQGWEELLLVVFLVVSVVLLVYVPVAKNAEETIKVK